MDVLEVSQITIRAGIRSCLIVKIMILIFASIVLNISIRLIILLKKTNKNITGLDNGIKDGLKEK